MQKLDIINSILRDRPLTPRLTQTQAFAPMNIALCKYWGKRDAALNLPVTSSLSMTLPTLGSTTHLRVIDAAADTITLNDTLLAPTSDFAQKLIAFLDLFRTNTHWRLAIDTYSDIPVAAGLASSASGFAALVLALNQLFAWELDATALSILARLGSGSACRSLWPGFVLWQHGTLANGMDSHGIPFAPAWPDLKMGLLIFHTEKKSISSRIAMQRTVETSVLYHAWPEQVAQDLPILQQAILARDFTVLGTVTERNALAMHATLQAAWPPIMYTQTVTLQAMQYIWQLRAEGTEVYFTQDAGPHLKLLCQAKDVGKIQEKFKEIHIITP